MKNSPLRAERASPDSNFKQLFDVVTREGGRPSIPEAAVLEPSSLWDTGSPACAGHDSGEHDSAFSRLISPELCEETLSLKLGGGHRECRAHDAPAARCGKK